MKRVIPGTIGFDPFQEDSCGCVFEPWDSGDAGYHVKCGFSPAEMHCACVGTEFNDDDETAVAQPVIQFNIKRNAKGKHSVLGDFEMKCEGVFEPVTGVTLELPRGTYDMGIGLGSKPYPIPKGAYTGKHTKNRFDSFMIAFDSVPGYSGVQIHKGNHPWNSHACILLGVSSAVNVPVKKSDVKAHERVTAEDRWNYAVKGGLIKAPPGADKGLTDAVYQSGKILATIAERYEKAEQKFGKGKVTFAITITEGDEAKDGAM